MDQFSDLRADVAVALSEADRAANVRAELRRRARPGDPERLERIDAALDRLRDVMPPLRSAIGRLIWEPLPDDVEQELRDASARVQYERRQLKKLRKADLRAQERAVGLA